MRRYVTGMVTGSLMGAVVAGFWLLRRTQRRPSARAMRQIRQFGPAAYKVARYGGTRLVRLAKRRIS